MKYLGDFPTGAVIYIPFATYDKDDGSSITMTGLAVTDIEIYKNGSATQRASDAGYTLLDTDGIDFDAITGIHGFSVDTSDNTDAGFYAAGSEYWVVVSAVTVDAVTVNFIAATFSIERSGAALALLKNATYGLSALETIVDDLEGRLTATRAGYIDNLSAGAVALASGVTVTTNSDKTGYSLSQAFPTNFSSLSITAGGLVDITQAAADKVWSTAARTLTSFGTLIADIWSYATRLLTAGTNIALAKGTGVTGFNDLSAAQVNTEVDTAFTDNMGTAGAGLTALGDTRLANLDAPVSSRASQTSLDTLDDYVDTEVAAIKAKTDQLTFTEANKVDANALSLNSNAGSASKLQRSTAGIATGTVGSGSTATNIVTSALSPAAAVTDQFKGKIVTFDSATTTAALRSQSTDITASTAAGVLTVTALTTAPVSGDTFVIT